MRTSSLAPVPLLRLAVFCAAALFFAPSFVQIASAAPPKTHSVVLGATRKVPYTSPEGAPAAVSLSIRPLLVDGVQKEWTTGATHAVTDRSFVVRRILRLNDALPSDAAEHWVWQPGPWLLVDRATGHISALRLPDFDPAISDVVWYRDYAAYCGIADTTRGGLFAIVAQLGSASTTHRVAQKQIAKSLANHASPICAAAQWNRNPLTATITPTGATPITFEITGSASLIEEGSADSDDTPQ